MEFGGVAGEFEFFLVDCDSIRGQNPSFDMFERAELH
jgi:hypothetical protein